MRSNIHKPIVPFFNWVGSKRRYCQRLYRFFPKNYDLNSHTYYEPFLGSGALFLALQPKSAVVGNIDMNVTSAFENIRYDLSEVITHLSEMYKGDVKTNYGNLCGNFTALSGIRQTAALIFVTKHSFGSNLIMKRDRTGFGLCYRNKIIGYNVENMQRASRYLKDHHVAIENKSFTDITKAAKRNDFVFLDPPYINTLSTKKRYYNDSDQISVETLVKEILRLHQKRCLVMLVNSDSPILREALSSTFTCESFDAHESITGVHGKKYSNQRLECIYINW
ncbi:S-adenosyl-L-methionine-dependent methyltransferase [Gaertneriomyces semiglobifer]|nr:S-adenosyl-L-methionine-dependent methyltransferase [Gaertneriomyces semiglobifer]